MRVAAPWWARRTRCFPSLNSSASAFAHPTRARAGNNQCCLLFKSVQPCRVVDEHRAACLVVRQETIDELDERVLLWPAAFLLAMGVRPVGAEDAAVRRSLVKRAAERHHVIPALRLRRHAVAVAQKHP